MLDARGVHGKYFIEYEISLSSFQMQINVLKS